jgi:hypothetical protein
MRDVLTVRQLMVAVPVAVAVTVVGLAPRFALGAALMALIAVLVACRDTLRAHWASVDDTLTAGNWPAAREIAVFFGATIAMGASGLVALSLIAPTPGWRLGIHPGIALEVAFLLVAYPVTFFGRAVIRRATGGDGPPETTSRELLADAAWFGGLLVATVGTVIITLTSSFASPHPVSMLGIATVGLGLALAFVGTPVAFVVGRRMDAAHE